jgi:hypothetical protein
MITEKNTHWILVLVLCIGFYGFYHFTGMDQIWALNNQLQQVIKNHDKGVTSQIAVDEETRNFLLQLPKDATVNSTTDFQGGGFVNNVLIGYYRTRINNQPVAVLMKIDTRLFYQKLFPKYTLYKVALDSRLLHIK